MEAQVGRNEGGGVHGGNKWVIMREGGGAWRQQVGHSEGGGVHGGNKWVIMREGGGCMEATSGS